MQNKFQSFITHFAKNGVEMENPNLNGIIRLFQICFYDQNSNDIENNNEIILQLKVENDVIIFDEYQDTDGTYLIMCFDNIIFILNQIKINILTDFIINNQKAAIYYFSENIKNLIQINIYRNLPYFYRISKDDQMYNKFKCNFVMKKPKDNINQTFWKIISPCITSYLIKSALINSFCNRYNIAQRLYNYKTPNIHLEENEYIKISFLQNGSSGSTFLIYLLEYKSLCVLKVLHPNINPELLKREINNYSKINHPFIPRYFGTANCSGEEAIIIEYIHGKTLDNYPINKLSDDEKIKLFFEITNAIYYLHSKGFIYRDLKPNNIILDHKKTAVLIDFDRMICPKEYNKTMTVDFSSSYIAPEIPLGSPFTNKSDYYSLGQLLYFIFTGKNPVENISNNVFPKSIANYDNIVHIYKHMTQEKPENRIDGNNIPNGFLPIFYDQLLNVFSKNLLSTVKFLKASAKYNDPFSQLILGKLYLDGKYVKRDIKKSIFYFNQASKQNLSNAYVYLGIIYLNGIDVTKDFSKSFTYFSHAKNNYTALYYLGCFYYKGIVVQKDIQKAIQYFKLSSQANIPMASYYLGEIYMLEKDFKKSLEYLQFAAGENVPGSFLLLGLNYFGQKDYNNAIHYLTIAADQNDSNAQNLLGCLYYQGLSGEIDMNKAIKYLTLAANQNHPYAQMTLVYIYKFGQNIKPNADKSFIFLNMLSNNHTPAPFLISNEIKDLIKTFPSKLQNIFQSFSKNPNGMQAISLITQGISYLEGDFGQKDIHKAIDCLTQAANLNSSIAQLLLGVIYQKGYVVPVDLYKAKYYFELAAKQNFVMSHSILGLLLLDEKFSQHNIKEGLKHLFIAAGQNDKESQYRLGKFYYDGRYVKRDIHASIHYFSLASDNQHPKAQFYLGLIYYNGKYLRPNYAECLYYFTLSADNNDTEAQYFLGYIYYEGKYTKRDINQSIKYFKKAAENGHYDSQFYLGVIFTENKYIEINIDESMNYYKRASSNNDPYSKNNLGAIYKNGLYGIQKNIPKAIEYFQEAIKNNKNCAAMFNLAHLYFYDKDDYDKSIELLIKLTIYCKHLKKESISLLSLILIKKYNNISETDIKNELLHYENKDSNLQNAILKCIMDKELIYKNNYDKEYNTLKRNDHMYSFRKKFISSSLFADQIILQILFDAVNNNNKNYKIKEINNLFYEGFALDLS